MNEKQKKWKKGEKETIIIIVVGTTLLTILSYPAFGVNSFTTEFLMLIGVVIYLTRKKEKRENEFSLKVVWGGFVVGVFFGALLIYCYENDIITPAEVPPEVLGIAIVIILYIVMKIFYARARARDGNIQITSQRQGSRRSRGQGSLMSPLTLSLPLTPQKTGGIYHWQVFG